MRVWGKAVGVLVIGVLAMPAAGAAAGGHLTGSTAKAVSEDLVETAIDKSDRLQNAELKACVRRTPTHIDCDFRVTGETTKADVECDFRVSVRVGDLGPVGRIEAKRCEAEEKPLLTYARAYDAMATVASETIGLPVAESFDQSQPVRALLSLRRVSRSSFSAFAGWYPKLAGNGQSDLCLLDLLANGSDKGGVVVEIGKSTCFVG